jgi:hypothetical protein
MLIILQTTGEWRTRDVKLLPYHEHLEELAGQFEDIIFTHMPRNKNQFADALATLASMSKISPGNEILPLQIRINERPAHCCAIHGPDEKPWFIDIKKYLESGEFPEGSTRNDRKVIQRMACNYFLSGPILYKKSFDATLLRCVDAGEAGRLMEEIHEGCCGPHMNGRMLSKKIMRLGYFWSTMLTDCIRRVQRCHLCQVYANQIHAPPKELYSMTSPWPFSVWGIDVIGMISPIASNGHRFILVAIDYFTKWVEAISLTSVTAKAVERFIRRDIIARYGVPESIITDNAKNLNNKLVDGLCNQFKVKHRNSSPYRPQMNGAVEAANKNIKKIVEKMTITYKDWHEKLPWALMAYRTSIRTSTGATPFSLVYGTEAVLPIEVEIPSARILAEAEMDESEWARSRHEQLNLIDEKRLTALCHGQLYQQRTAKAFNKRVRPREIQEGDLVLRKILKINPDSRGKFTPKYEGPYVVKRTFGGGAVIITEMDGQELPSPINTDSLKKYYP